MSNCVYAQPWVHPSNTGGGGTAGSQTDQKELDSLGGGTAVVSTTNKWHSTDYGSMQFGSNLLLKPQRTFAAGVRQITVGFPFMIDGVPAIAANVCQANGPSHQCKVNASGVFQIGPNNTNYVSVFTPNPGQWYWISISYDTSANPHAMVVTVYNQTGGLVVAPVSAGLATAAADITSYQHGQSATVTAVTYYVGPYVIFSGITTLLPRKVHLLAVTTNGTHSFTANDFQNAASGNLTTASDIAQYVDEYPASLVDFVKQVVIRSTGYAEFAHADLPASGYGSPEYVSLHAGVHPVGSNAANSSQFRLNDGGTITAEAVIDASVAADTLEYRVHHYATRPNGGGEWDATSVNALVSRYGYSGDVTPPPALDGILMSVVTPITFSPLFAPLIG